MTDEQRAPQRLAPSPALIMILQARAVEQRVEAELRELGLSLRRLGLMGHLRATPGISFSELARRAGIKVQSLHPIVDALLEQGLVTTVGGVGQGRAAVIELTAAGDETARRATNVLAAIDRELFTDGAWKDLGEALVRVSEPLRTGRAPGASRE